MKLLVVSPLAIATNARGASDGSPISSATGDPLALTTSVVATATTGGGDTLGSSGANLDTTGA